VGRRVAGRGGRQGHFGGAPQITPEAPGGGGGGGVTVTSIDTAVGGYRDSVVIAGTGFESGQAVLFGSTSADNIVYTSSIRIDCDVPTGETGLTDVSVAGVTLSDAILLPDLEIDFEDYADTAALVAAVSDNGHAIFKGINFLENNGATVNLDTGVGYGVLTKSMRYDYEDRTGAGGSRCNQQNATVCVRSLSGTELWAEFYIRFSSNYTTVTPAGWSCGNPADHKLVFHRVLPNGKRYSLKTGVGTSAQRWAASTPGAEDEFPDPLPDPWNDTEPLHPDNWWDATFYRFRFHILLSTTDPGSDGVYEVWMGDTKVQNITGRSISGATSWKDIYLGANRTPSDVATNVWWGRLRWWLSDPSW